MGKYPVVSVSLKGIDTWNYETAFQMAAQTMKRAPAKVQYLLESDVLSEQDKKEYQKLLDDNMSEAVFCNILRVLSELLEKHHGTKVILSRHLGMNLTLLGNVCKG